MWLLRYVVYRLLWLVPTLLAMALVTFLVMHATPGSPLDPVAEGANPLSPEAQKNLAEVYGLDKPLYAQFGIFLGKALQVNGQARWTNGQAKRSGNGASNGTGNG